MTSVMHLLEIAIAVAAFGWLLYWAFNAWSRSHEQHREKLKSRQLQTQAWDTRGRNR